MTANSITEAGRRPLAAKQARPILTIVVPAWRMTYLEAALESIDGQSDKRFTVVVFDDAGPKGIAELVRRRFPDFGYVRFDENLGGRDLIAHWSRCLNAVQTDWVWLFSDDDLMAPNCVEQFHNALQLLPECKVFQFKVRQVTADLVLIREFVPDRKVGAGLSIIKKLKGESISCVPDHVFNLAYLKQVSGGFINFPLAWNSDDATWAILARENGIGGIPEAEVLWRQSNENISARTDNLEWKLRADIQYLQWLNAERFRVPYILQLRWLAGRLKYVYQKLERSGSSGIAVLPFRLRPAVVLATIIPLVRRVKFTVSACTKKGRS